MHDAAGVASTKRIHSFGFANLQNVLEKKSEKGMNSCGAKDGPSANWKGGLQLEIKCSRSG